jgi:hypothetical protein
MTKKPKAKGSRKHAPKKGKAQRSPQAAREPRAAESGSLFERAFAKITPPKGFSIKRPH